ncbi:hydrolase [Oceanobacillus alkalisoli]|uniref:hydrolase n=1 Tax=Oceanobacillus alkalisoli TaxID=2925113 RepID=UPI001EF07318|nr:hydrolase [Oceanobacillus alkalisoli]MCF3943488.1 hydrolase [Oceanobacillus alkalisoli]MCG5104076.1 hydrolase [Oceanobacillus alkalisoli]
MKEKYYVNIAEGGISQETEATNATFGIYADNGEIGKLREKMTNMDDANNGSYIRAHSPFFPQDESPENARYDNNLKDLYALLYELGDEETKAHIESIGILNEPGDNLV